MDIKKELERLKTENARMAKQVADFNAVAGSNQKRYERAEAELRNVKTLREYDKSFKAFVTDICYDYKKQPELGLLAIRVLCKEKKTEEDFREVWLKWRDNQGLSAPKERDDEI